MTIEKPEINYKLLCDTFDKKWINSIADIYKDTINSVGNPVYFGGDSGVGPGKYYERYKEPGAPPLEVIQGHFHNFLRKVNSLHDREIPLVNEGFELESTHFNVVCSSSVPALNDNLYVPDVFLYDIGWYEQLNINTHRVIYEYDTMIAVSVRNGMKHDFLGS